MKQLIIIWFFLGSVLLMSQLAQAGTTAPRLRFVANSDYGKTVRKLLSKSDLKKVDVFQFSWKTSNTGSTHPKWVLQKIIALHKSGKKIRVFMENAEHIKSNKETIEALREAGVPIRESRHNVSHTKAIVVNDKFLLLGSTNLTMSSTSLNNETNALITSVNLGQGFKDYYESVWGQAAKNKKELSASKGERLIAMEVVDNDTSLITDDFLLPKILAVIKRATLSIDIATYFLAYRQGKEKQDAAIKGVMDAIVARKKELASQGIDLRLRFFLDNNGISDRQYEKTLSAKNALRYLSGLIKSVRAELAKSGKHQEARSISQANVYWDSFHKISHGKFIIVDPESDKPEVLFGSSNLFVGDLFENHQINIHSTRKDLVDKFAEYMTEQIEKSVKIPYYRFWRGKMRKHWPGSEKIAFTKKDFLITLNDWLIPATLSCCSTSSLTAYLPALPPENLRIPAFTHDELALIVYKSESKYLEARSEDLEGKAYGPIHSWVFDMELPKESPDRSGSLVPSPYLGKVVLRSKLPRNKNFGVAYDVLSKEVDWQTGYVRYVFHQKRVGVDEPTYLARVNRYLGKMKHLSRGSKTIKGLIVLITKNYLIEIQNWISADKISYENFLSEVLTLESQLTVVQPERISTSNDSLHYQNIRSGEVFQFQFDLNEVLSQRVKHPLLCEQPYLCLEKYFERKKNLQ